MLAKKGIKTACGEKRVTVTKREQCRRSSRRRFPEVSGGYEGIKERFCELEGLTAVLKCIINRLDCRARKDKMPTLASGRLVSLGCYELISAMLVRKPLLVGRTILKQAGGGGGSFGNIPSSSVRKSSCKLSGPSPASVCARIVMPYSVHFSRFSRRYGELCGGIPSILLEILLPSVVEYWMEYPVMTPF